MTVEGPGPGLAERFDAAGDSIVIDLDLISRDEAVVLSGETVVVTAKGPPSNIPVPLLVWEYPGDESPRPQDRTLSSFGALLDVERRRSKTSITPQSR